MQGIQFRPDRGPTEREHPRLLVAATVALLTLGSATVGIYLGYVVGYGNGKYEAESESLVILTCKAAPFDWNTFAPNKTNF